MLDTGVVRALKENLFTQKRLTEPLSSLAERRAARTTAANSRLVALQTEVASVEQKLKRLYQSIADGIDDLDDLLDSGDTPALKACLRLIPGSVIVGDKTIKTMLSRRAYGFRNFENYRIRVLAQYGWNGIINRVR